MPLSEPLKSSLLCPTRGTIGTSGISWKGAQVSTSIAVLKDILVDNDDVSWQYSMIWQDSVRSTLDTMVVLSWYQTIIDMQRRQDESEWVENGDLHEIYPATRVPSLGTVARVARVPTIVQLVLGLVRGVFPIRRLCVPRQRRPTWCWWDKLSYHIRHDDIKNEEWYDMIMRDNVT